MSENHLLQDILSNYNFYQLRKIRDFLVSEIDEDNLQETIEFIKSSDREKSERYKDILYNGNKYTGLFLEGNQYLISNSKNEVLIIDMVGEENGISKDQTRINIDMSHFINLLRNKKIAVKWIKRLIYEV